MPAIDANVLVRVLTGDDPDQAARARALVTAGPVFLPLTVCLEAEWVLRSGYGFPPDRIAAALRAFAGLPTVQVEAPARLALALDRMAAGMDFADALHLGAAPPEAGFATFDRRMIRAAARLGLAGVREP